MTHYSYMRFPVQWEGSRDIDSVCRPSGLKWGYFDLPSGQWPGRYRPRPSFLSRVKLSLPTSCLFRKQIMATGFSEAIYGQSSYEVMASTSSCPAGVNVHEFVSFQNTASGISRRWLTILAELGSPNLNFSAETTYVLLNHLAMQCGPLDPTDHMLRRAHLNFKDLSFCFKLLALLEERLVTVTTNWRESHLMDLIITLGTRIADISVAAQLETVTQRATDLLTKARKICVQWLHMLSEETDKISEEIDKTSDPEGARRAQRYALWAALLCKKTYLIHLRRHMQWDASVLEIFVQSSITVAENLLIASESLPLDLRRAVTHDVRMSLGMNKAVYNYISSHPDAFASALATSWPTADGEARRLINIRKTNHFWAVANTQEDDDGAGQEVMYNFVEGVLLINRSRQGVRRCILL